MKCREQLNADLLQLKLIVSPATCSHRNERTCQIEIMTKFANIIQQLDIIPISLQFEDGTVERINMKLCRLGASTGNDHSIFVLLWIKLISMLF